MDDDYRELAHRLFAAATAMLEDAIEVAVAGQSPRIPPSQLAVHARRLQGSARDIAVIVDALQRTADIRLKERQDFAAAQVHTCQERSP